MSAGRPIHIISTPPRSFHATGYGAGSSSKRSSYPVGMHNLIPVDQLLVQQDVDETEVTMGIEAPNKYKILNSTGQLMFTAEEFQIKQGGALRPFEIRIRAEDFHEVLRVKRPYRCDSCCCPCCLQKVSVTTPNRSPVGFVKQKWSLGHSKFIVENAHHDPQMQVIGPCCTTCSCGKDINFKIQTLDGKEIGVIQKQWSGFLQEAFSDADNFRTTFPRDLDPHMKAVILGACFLVDFMYFEEAPANRKQGRRGRR